MTIENVNLRKVKRSGYGLYMNGKRTRAIDKDKRNRVVHFTFCLLSVHHQNLPLKEKQAGGRGKYGCSHAAE